MNRQLLLDVRPAPAPTLANYLVGPNAEAVAAVRALAPGHALYVWGPAGCGRSHLLRARAAQTAHPDSCYLDAPNARRRLEALSTVESAAMLPALIAVDDLHQMDTAGQAALFSLYNRWREAAATRHAFALVVAGDRAPLAMPLREDLRTRLGWDLVCRLDLLPDTDKLAALSTQAAERGLHLAPEILNWMLTHYERDMRHLAALIDALDRYSLATRRPLTLPLLRTMLADLNLPLM